MAQFEVISKYADAGLALPERKTEGSAGHDMVAAEDIVVPSPLGQTIPTIFKSRDSL